MKSQTKAQCKNKKTNPVKQSLHYFSQTLSKISVQLTLRLKKEFLHWKECNSEKNKQFLYISNALIRHEKSHKRTTRKINPNFEIPF